MPDKPNRFSSDGMLIKMRRIVIIILVCGLLAGCAGTTPTERTTLVVFGAGSLIIPFNHLEKAFEARYPQIDLQAEYHGSIQVIRHVSELHEQIDVVATADASLIPMLMYSVNDPDSGKPYANWYFRFATNHLALAYTPQSKYAQEINAENWTEILSRPDIKVGLADPRFDAAGYRTLMAFALANDYYRDPKIFSRMFSGCFTSPISLFQDDDLATITVPEIIETKTGSRVVVRGASIQLIALLQAGELDYAFEYESVIRQHGLQMLALPDALNLGSETVDYSGVEVDIGFQRFATVKPVFRGEQIGYGITIPSNAPHPEEAALFIAFLLGPDGRSLMEADYHPMFSNYICDTQVNMPAELQIFCTSQSSP
jgi:molybdate/tungstate transport system substrate-binding protein